MRGDVRKFGILQIHANQPHIRAPVEPRRERLKRCNAKGIVGRDGIALLGLGPASGCNAGLKIDDGLRFQIRVGPANEMKQRCDISLEFRLWGGVSRLEIVVAIGKAQARLRRIEGLALWILQVDVGKHREKPRIEITRCFSHKPRNGPRRVDAADSVELGMDR